MGYHSSRDCFKGQIQMCGYGYWIKWSMRVARLWCERQEQLSQLYERRVVRKARVIVDDNRGGGRVREGLGDSAGGGGGGLLYLRHWNSGRKWRRLTGPVGRVQSSEVRHRVGVGCVGIYVPKLVSVSYKDLWEQACKGFARQLTVSTLSLAHSLRGLPCINKALVLIAAQLLNRLRRKARARLL